jgi:hypothetical protein
MYVCVSNAKGALRYCLHDKLWVHLSFLHPKLWVLINDRFTFVAFTKSMIASLS